MKNKKRNQKGGMLLEMILMVTVLVIILPIIQAQSKKQIELSENILIVKDMLKLYKSVEGFVGEYKSDILENISSSSKDVCKVSLSDISVVLGPSECGNIMTEEILNKHGIFEASSTNVLDKSYAIYLRVVSTESTQSIEALIIGENPSAQIKSKKASAIVKELGSYGAYVEADKIMGFGWESDLSDWNPSGFNLTDDISENDVAILFSSNTKAGNFIAKKYTDQEDFNKMTTNMFMSLKNIENLRAMSSKYIVSNYMDIRSPIEADELILSKDDGLKSFQFRNLYTDVMTFPAYGDDLNNHVLTLDSSNTPVINGDIYFYGEAESSSASVVYAQGVTTERFMIGGDLTLQPNHGFEISGYVRANNVDANHADVHMIFGDILYTNGRVTTDASGIFYLDTSTDDHRFNSLVISKASSLKNLDGSVNDKGLANKTLYKTSFAENSTFTELFKALEAANTKMDAYITENSDVNNQ
ncbi:MAG: hypothetical protein N4A44_01820 [Alphaproteobacteria bacterium]|jgi:hypothetical protein|nr:hypothetical protein [Alphaproteobacteria bacterium]